MLKNRVFNLLLPPSLLTNWRQAGRLDAWSWWTSGIRDTNICCTHLSSYTFSESWVRKDSRANYEKVPFFTDFRVRLQKKVSGWCTHNFDATDLPNSWFEPLYPNLFRGAPIVDLGPVVWHTDPPTVRKPQNRARRKRLFFGVFLGKNFSWLMRDKDTSALREMFQYSSLVRSLSTNAR